MNIKKIIAREGLIIISILLLILISFMLPDSIVIKDKGIQPKETEEVYEITTKGHLLIEKLYTVLWDKTKVEPQNKWDRYIVETKSKNDISHLNIIKEAISLSELKSILLAILLSAYPFYWLIRFIIWAIKTLKEKK